MTAKIYTHLWYAKDADQAAQLLRVDLSRLARRARLDAAHRVAERPGRVR